MKQIPLSGKLGAGLFVIVDDEDFPVLNRIRWRLSNGYPRNNGAGQMPHLLLGYPLVNRFRTVDHIDRDPLNNQKSNLRLVTHQVNMFNRRGHVNSMSKYKGVGKYASQRTPTGRPWRATCVKTIDGKRKSFYLGHFATEEEAARAYDAKARILYDGAGYLNFPSEGEKQCYFKPNGKRT